MTQKPSVFSKIITIILIIILFIYVFNAIDQIVITKRSNYQLICIEDSFSGIIRSMEYDRGFLLVDTHEKLMLNDPTNEKKILGYNTPYIEQGDSIYKKVNSIEIHVLNKKHNILHTFTMYNILCNNPPEWIKHKE